MDVQRLADVQLADSTGSMRASATSGPSGPSWWCSSDISADSSAASTPRSCASTTTRSEALGGDVIAIGTGSVKYAASFAEDEHVPFPVLVDDHSHAAHAAQVKRVNFKRRCCSTSEP